MLNTVLKIGKTFRESPDALKHHRYIKPCPGDSEKWQVLRLSLPVTRDFIFKFDAIEEISDENLSDKLYYLSFQTSDADTSKKYVFGDIYYSRNNKNKESGNYRTTSYSNYDAFERAKSVIGNLQNKRILNFRAAFGKEKDQIENIFLNYSSWKEDSAYNAVLLHFDLSDSFWHAKEEIDELSRLMIEHFCSESAGDYVFDSMLYRTLCSGDPKNDIQFPNFKNSEKYKSKSFTLSEANDLFYAIDFIEKPSFRLSKNIQVVVLPNGNDLSVDDYENFSISRESIVKYANESHDKDLIFAPLIEEIAENIVNFDVVFVQKERVFSDLIEISGLEKSLIKETNNRIINIRLSLEGKCDKKLLIRESFKNILSDKTKDERRYQSHLLAVLPKIYTNTYYHDPSLLPALIKKTEKNIRDDKVNFNLLKYDFIFLISIQNIKIKGGNLMKIQESQSYKIGLLLGELAKQFSAWRDDCPIKSFEKSHVGTLSRRISTLNDLIKFKMFIEEKLVMHERTIYTHQASVDLAEAIKKKELENGEKYDKYKCAFGFFENYFAPVTEKQLILNTNNKGLEN